MNENTAKFVILYAEDDEDDVQLVKDCFQQYSDHIEILHVENGREALTALERLHLKGIQPCLIILDINMPGMDGREALMLIKTNTSYKEIPVVLFTTSSSVTDKLFAQKWGADFITKPLHVDDLENLAQEFAQRCKQDILKRA